MKKKKDILQDWGKSLTQKTAIKSSTEETAIKANEKNCKTLGWLNSQTNS